MAEAKREIDYRAPVREFDNTKTVITKIKDPLNDGQKFEIVFPIPETDEEAQERYNCSMADLVRTGVVNLTTRVNYHNETTFEGDGSGRTFIAEDYKDGDVEKTHALMQEAADCYVCGARRTATGGQKALAKKKKEDDAKLAKAGFGSVEDILAKAVEWGMIAEPASDSEE